MSRVLAAHQPNYLPWLGLFHKVGNVDVWVVADDVQFPKHGLTNRNRVRTATGWQWLTVPVLTKGKGSQSIRQVEIDDARNWRDKHLKSLRWNYSKARYFARYEEFLARYYETDWRHLVDLNMEFCRFALGELQIEIELRRTSEFEVREDRTLRLLDLALALDCGVYLAGAGSSRQYLDLDVFEQAGIECRFSKFSHPVYPQCFPGFEPSLSTLDLLLNCGPASREVLFG